MVNVFPFSLCRFFLIIIASAAVTACHAKDAFSPQYVIVGVADGNAALLQINEDYQLQRIALPNLQGLNYISRADGHMVAAIRDSEILLIDPNVSEVGSPLIVAKTASPKSPTAIDVSPDGTLFFSAHFFDNKLNVRGLDGTDFLPPQEFDCEWAHQFRPHPNGQWAYAACMKNTVQQFTIDQDTMRVAPMATSSLTVAGGPRHMTFHPNGKTLYLMLQISSEIAVIDINSTDGTLIMPPRQILTTTKQGGKNKTSDVQITPNGKWLYGFNRRDQAMSIFSVDEDGSLQVSSVMQMPYGEVRHFALSPRGDVLVTVTDKGYAGLWHINDGDGSLNLTSEVIGLGKAVSALILP